MQAMQLQAGRSAAEQAEVFARQLHGNWGVGRAGCDDGVLLLLSVQDRQVRRMVSFPQYQSPPVLPVLKPLFRARGFPSMTPPQNLIADVALQLRAGHYAACLLDTTGCLAVACEQYPALLPTLLVLYISRLHNVRLCVAKQRSPMCRCTSRRARARTWRCRTARSAPSSPPCDRCCGPPTTTRPSSRFGLY